MSFLKNKIDDIFYFFTLTFCFLLPIWSRGASFIIILMITTWLLDYLFYRKIHLALGGFGIAMIFFFSIQVFSLFFSDNQNVAWSKLETKLSLVIFPLILMSRKKIRHIHVKILEKFFVLGTLVISLITLGWATYQYLFLNASNSIFFRFKLQSLAFNLHPTYAGLYIAYAIILIFYYYIFQDEPIFKKKYINLFIGVFLLVFIVLVNSRINILALCTILPLGLIISFFQKKQIIKGISLVVLFLSLVFVLNFSFSMNNKRFRELGKDSRLSMWNCAKNPIWDNWFLGVGVGDVTDVLVKEYSVNNLEAAVKYRHNAHNIFLQVVLATGMFGLVTFILIFYYLISSSFTNRDYLLLFFVLLILISGLTESTFNRSAGIMFFSFFSTIYIQKQK